MLCVATKKRSINNNSFHMHLESFEGSAVQLSKKRNHHAIHCKGYHWFVRGN